MCLHLSLRESACSGFSLVEMAVVLVIVGLLMAGLLGPLGAQLEARRLAQTKTVLENSKEALLGFAVQNKRLPCPANPSTSGTGEGLEDLNTGTGSCNRLVGALPWVTLGVSKVDGWDRRVTYRVSNSFSRSGSLPNLSSSGDITVRASSGGTIVANNLPVVLVSHGKDGLGGYANDGSGLAAATGDQLENSNGDTTFISRNADESYDDVTAWLPTTLVLGRMVSAGVLP